MQSYSGKAKSYCTERRSISIIYHMIRKIIRFVLVSQIGQAHPAPNHSAHHHLSINCTHLFGINTLIRTHTSLHSVSGRSPTKWIHSNAIQALSRNTYLVYSPFVSPPVCFCSSRQHLFQVSYHCGFFTRECDFSLLLQTFTFNSMSLLFLGNYNKRTY